MACRLGCDDRHTVTVMDRCSRQVVGDITGAVSFLKYGRELDDYSECDISVHFESDAAGRACCEVLADTRTWRHEITVTRDGEVTWQGPIINLSYQRAIGRIRARDVMAWLDRRVVRNSYSFVDVDLTDIAVTCIEDALSAHNDVCILDYMQTTPTGVAHTMDVVGRQRYAGEVLRELAEGGLDFTVVGRSLIIGGDFAFGPVGPLFDEHFLNDVEVEERGLSAATKWYFTGKDPEVHVGECGGVDPYYGLIERAVETFRDSEDADFLRSAACDRAAVTNPPPLHVSIPDGAQLSPDAPLCPRLLVPGTLVDLDIRNLCRRATARQRLTAVEFRVDDKGEAVGVVVVPMGAALEAEEDAE